MSKWRMQTPQEIEAEMEQNKKKTYSFEVPAFYHYEIEANSEDEARAILEEKGGIEIDGTLCELDYRDYQKAKLIKDLTKED